MCGTSWTNCGPDRAQRPSPRLIHAKRGKAAPRTENGFVSPLGGTPFLCAGFTLLTLLLLTWLLLMFCFPLFRYYLDMHVIEMGTPPLVKTAARLFRELCYSNKSQLMAGIICAGWDSAKGGQVRTENWSIVGVSCGGRLRTGGVTATSCIADNRFFPTR